MFNSVVKLIKIWKPSKYPVMGQWLNKYSKQCNAKIFFHKVWLSEKYGIFQLVMVISKQIR